MFIVIGNNTTIAIFINLPKTKHRPQINSINFAKGSKYTVADTPSIKVFMLVDISGGGGDNLKKYDIEAKSINRPIRVRIIIVAIFIVKVVD